MKRSIIARLAAGAAIAFSLVGIATPSRAWYGAGHMAVAIVAYRELKPQARTAVDTILKAHPDYAEWVKEIPADATPDQRSTYLFAIAATWPDRIKSNKDQSVTIKFYDAEGRTPPPSPLPTSPNYPDLLMHKDWHYIDTPIDTDGVARRAPTPNAVTQIAICRDGVAASKSAPSYRAYYLSWLEHLVGDVHQPLHATGRFSAAFPSGDQGGNGVKLQHEGAHEPNNLHGYWDSLLGDEGGDGPGGYSYPTNWKSIEANVAAIIADEPKMLAGFDPETRDDLKPEDWAHESYVIDQDFVYTIGPDASGPLPQPAAAYHTTAVLLAHQRGALAGHRLALMLDAALATP